MINCLDEKVRLRALRNLIFFACLTLSTCQEEHGTIHLIWSGQHAVGISIAKNLINDANAPIDRALSIRMKSENPVNMLGNFSDEDSAIVFRPLVPFTRGLSYQVVNGQQVIATIEIPLLDKSKGPVLSGIFPSGDSVPENLLKIHLKFSKPMSEGHSLHYLTLIDNHRDTVRGAFLDLQPELWNSDRDLMTVWLDPGRIKRGLHPNKQYGAPLTKGTRYTLVVSQDWRDVDNAPLSKVYEKSFVVLSRDSLSPDPSLWAIHSPKVNTRNAACVDFKSPLDFSLISSALHIVDTDEQVVTGTWSVENHEKCACFMPNKSWNKGKYELRIEPRLEDLAGNRIDRPFEVEIGANSVNGGHQLDLSLPFNVYN